MTSISRSPKSNDESSSGQEKSVVTKQIHSTGNRWTDMQLAVKRISVWDDLKHLGEIPCARTSLLSVIASGFGIGVIRGINTRLLIAANWAMGTFLVVSVGMWNFCRAGIRREREQIRVKVEQIAERRLRRVQQDSDKEKSESGVSTS